MAPSQASLYDLPPELLLQILALLPIRSLLSFSGVSRAAYSLSTLSLHSLSFGVYPTRIASVLSKLAVQSNPPATSTHSAFNDACSLTPYSPSSSIDELPEDPYTSPYTVSVIIPEAQNLPYSTLAAFQCALQNSVLDRYQNSLRNLDLSLWALNSQTACTLRSLRNLRSLSLRIEDPAIRQGGRRRAAQKRTEERAAWGLLEGAWLRLEALRIDGAEVTVAQISGIVEGNESLREIWVRKCPRVGSTLWSSLANNRNVQKRLEILVVNGCGGDIDQWALEQIGLMGALKYLALVGIRETKTGSIEKANVRSWHIPELIISKLPATIVGDPGIIEVDPAYLNDDHEATYRGDLTSVSSSIVEAAA